MPAGNEDANRPAKVGAAPASVANSPTSSRPNREVVIRAIRWVVVIAAVGIIFDNLWGRVDRLNADSETAKSFVGVVEPFDTAGNISTTGRFLVPTGNFMGQDGAARRDGEADAFAIASLPGDRIGGVAARIRNASYGDSLVFRFQSPTEYWRITPHPSRDTWVLERVRAGVAEQVSELSRIATHDEVYLAVELSGDDIVVRSSGRLVSTAVDPYLADAPSAGFASVGQNSGDATFDDVVIYYPAESDT